MDKIYKRIYKDKNYAEIIKFLSYADKRIMRKKLEKLKLKDISLYKKWNIYKNQDIIHRFFNNSVEHIIYINLPNCVKRNNNMTKLLKLTSIPYSRVDAINGKDNLDLKKKYLNNLELSITNTEIACCLSHIKAISKLKKKKINGEYFLVCEDDISLNNLILSKYTLKQIIDSSPEFDILQINKTINYELPDNYVSWNEYYKKKKHIAGTVCYIISRKGIDNFIQNVGYFSSREDKFKNIKENFCEADKYIYNNLKTISYKYNFITTVTNHSNIHTEHLEMHKKVNLIQDLVIIKNLKDQI